MRDDYGMEIHEMSHVIQRYQQREFWVTEGIADYIRYYVVEPGSPQGRFDPATAHYKNGYQAASAFLNWMENKYGKPTGHSIISRLQGHVERGLPATGLLRTSVAGPHQMKEGR